MHSMSVGPLLHSVGYDVHFFIRNDGVWNTMTVNEHFISLWMIVLAKVSHTKKGNPYPEYMSIPVRTKCFPSMMEVVQCSQPVTKELAGSLITPGNEVVLCTQCSFLLLADWALSGSGTRSSLVSGSP